jgi:predicted alpha/beta superfamily hydrolase
MKHIPLITAFFALLFYTGISQPQITKVETPGPSGIKFKSAIDSQEYILYITLPGDYGKTNKTYPVLYVTDAQWFYTNVLAAYFGQQYDGFVPDLIIIGITWPGDYDASRGRDFTPTQSPVFPNSGNAPKFLSVIKNEIITYIDSTYRTDKNNRALYGTSLGGIFAVYTLFHEPALFNRYMIISPSLWWDDEIAFKYEAGFAKKTNMLNAKIFISSGEFEEAIDFSKVFSRFNQRLKAGKYKGLELEDVVLEKMSHSASSTAGALRGLEFIYSKPDIAVTPILLDSYAGKYVLNSDTVLFSRQGSSLFMHTPGGEIKLSASSDDSFYIKGQNGTGRFSKGNKNKISDYTMILKDTTLNFKRID